MIIGVELFLALLKRNVFLLLIIHAVQAVKLYTVIMMEIGDTKTINGVVLRIVVRKLQPQQLLHQLNHQLLQLPNKKILVGLKN
jgi:hypothetical protein